MQPSAALDLAHTHARPVHWLATATAMAAVVAAAGLLQPGAATASQSGSAVTAAAAPGALAPVPAPDARAATYPLECGGAPTAVAKEASGDLDGDGRPETVTAVRCDAGSGTPPSGLYVLAARRDGTGARVVATLVEPAERLSASELAVRDGAVTATLMGYSSADVPRCCPDQVETVKWRWTGGKFVRSAVAEPSDM
ncbi:MULTISPECIES: hypothetical protein [unclassified Streptomyces]|uniref:hypothetical protein n=1 Tax=unclassified Streptomyces TaxID=2593676 RepID=UPI0033A29925